MKIIGINGSIHHGKSALAEFIKQQDESVCVFESSQVITEVANQLNKVYESSMDLSSVEGIKNWLRNLSSILSHMGLANVPEDFFAVSPEKLENPEFVSLRRYIEFNKSDVNRVSVVINAENKEKYRPLLQWIGGYCVNNINNSIWFDELLKRAETAEKSGCNLAVLLAIRFKSEADKIRQANGLVVRIVRPIAVLDNQDPTEIESSQIEPDVIIFNDGTIDNLYNKASILYADVLAGNTKIQY